METKDCRMIKLNIAYDYPVKWDLNRIMRDFIQNFYDAVGMMNFDKCVDYRVEQDDRSLQVVLDTDFSNFSYEWLIYIGASTKTGKNNFIGEYGEGFKMAALCLFRDLDCDFIMESQDWYIEPCTYVEEIDGNSHKMFGYNIAKRTDDGHTRLTIKKLSDNFINRRILNEIMLEFYYPENPLFGEKIYADEKVGIFERSSMPVPFRSGSEKIPEGVLYVKYLARGRLPFPFVICVNSFPSEYIFGEKRDRDRCVFFDTQTIKVMSLAAKDIPPEPSYILLCALKSYWNKLPANTKDCETWFYFVCQLVRNVASDEDTKAAFMNAYKKLVYIPRPLPIRREKKEYANINRWWNVVQDEECTKVIPVFRLLGAESLTERYYQYKKKSYLPPSETEKKRYDLVMFAAKKMLGLGDEIKIPELLICENDYYNPEEFSRRIYRKNKNANYSVGALYEIETVVMTKTDFENDSFDNTLIKAMDIMIHSFGTSKSDRVNSLLTEVGAVIMRNYDIIEMLRNEWNNL